MSILIPRAMLLLDFFSNYITSFYLLLSGFILIMVLLTQLHLVVDTYPVLRTVEQQ